MLYFSLGVSVILLLLTTLFVFKSKTPIAETALLCGGSFAFMCIGLVMPAVMLQAGALFVCVIGWSYLSGRPWWFVPSSLVATLLAYTAIWWFIVRPDIARENEYLAQFPSVSMSERIHEASPARIHGSVLKAPVADRLTRLETAADDLPRQSPWSLVSLHDDTTTRFVNSPGFGIHRGNAIQRERRYYLIKEFEKGKTETIGQPGMRETSAGGAIDNSSGTVVAAESSLHNLHHDSALEFLNPSRFGLVKNREQVLGFQSHRFSKQTTECAGPI
jgi:hypothetical protein